MCSFPESIIDKMFDWKKQEDKKEVFFYNEGEHYNNGRSGQDEQFKGRVFHFEDQLVSGNASIVIRKTQPGDSGNYNCDFPHDSSSRRAHVELIIRASPEPSLSTINQTNDWALLECEVKGASPEPVVEWRDGAGNILHAEEPKVTKNKEKENSFNVILQINVTKSDRYTCVSRQEKIDHQISKGTIVHLNRFEVDIKTVDKTDDGVLVQCSVRGASPEPKVQLKNRSGNTVPAAEPQVTERGGSYDIILQTTVKKTDYYQCVATQEEGGNPLHAETYVIVPDQRDSPTGWIVALSVVSIILVAVVVAFLLLLQKGFIKLKRNQGSPSAPSDSLSSSQLPDDELKQTLNA
ncbi:V-set domain-containing T-cell activation inhibitor 1-like isoform X2 [Embiotoca jacksoni]